jgi:hypothetical protein
MLTKNKNKKTLKADRGGRVAMTFSIMIFGIMALSIMTLSIMTLSITISKTPNSA